MSVDRGRMYLVLEDGTKYEGERIGATSEASGEVVFNTAMTGYQEMLTDPSYGGQLLVATYPMIGNYGVNMGDWESSRIQVSGFVVREHCEQPSHMDSTSTVHEYLLKHNTPGIAGVDTRAITRRLRHGGVAMGIITPREDVSDALGALRSYPRYDDVNYVAKVSTGHRFRWQDRTVSVKPGVSPRQAPERLTIVVTDYGVKHNILRCLEKRNCDVFVVPFDARPEAILQLNPDGLVLSPGPGDPRLLDNCVQSARALAAREMPIMGICLGHQVVARAFGGSTFKLKFGHRGGNHSVRDLVTGRVYVTTQNHGYAVSADGLPADLEVTHVNLSDGTIEGLRHTSLPIMTIQYHSEASPGPHDSEYLFDRFLDEVRARKSAAPARDKKGGARS